MSNSEILFTITVYINDKENTLTYPWNNKNYLFVHGKQIEVTDGDLWSEHIRFTNEFVDIFDGIMISIGEYYIEDITEPK